MYNILFSKKFSSIEYEVKKYFFKIIFFQCMYFSMYIFYNYKNGTSNHNYFITQSHKYNQIIFSYNQYSKKCLKRFRNVIIDLFLLNKKYTNVESHDCTAEYKKYTCYIWYFCTHYITHEMENDSWQSDKDPAWNSETSEERISLFDHRWKVENAVVIVPLKGRKEILRCV